MNRRTFMAAVAGLTGATAMVKGVGVASAQPAFKYPFIGQPMYGCIYRKEVWDMLVMQESKSDFGKFDHLIVTKNEFRQKHVEVFFKKQKLVSEMNPDRIRLPLRVTYIADFIMDMEVFKSVKDRRNERRYYDPPVGSNRQLVMKNRELYG